MARKIGITLMFAATFAIMAIMVAHASCELHADELYADIGIIYRIDEQTDEVFIMTSDGNEWIIDGAENWNIGDVVGIVFTTIGTEEIKDDEVVSVKYLWWMEFPSTFSNQMFNIQKIMLTT